MSIVYGKGKISTVGKYKDDAGNVIGYRLIMGDGKNPSYVMDVPSKQDVKLGFGVMYRSEMEATPCKLLSSVEEPKYKKEYLRVLDSDTGTVWVRVTDAAKTMKNVANFMTIINEGNFYKLWRKMNWCKLRIVDNGFFITLDGKTQSAEVNLDEIDAWLNAQGISGFTKQVWTAAQRETSSFRRSAPKAAKLTWDYSVGYSFINDKAVIPDVPVTRNYKATDLVRDTGICGRQYISKSGEVFEVSTDAAKESSAIVPPMFTTSKSYRNCGTERDDFLVSDDGKSLIFVKNLYELPFVESHSIAIDKGVRECVMNNAILCEVCMDMEDQLLFHEFEIKSLAHGLYRMSVDMRVDFDMVPYGVEEVVKAIESEFERDLGKAKLEAISSLIYPIDRVKGIVEMVSDDTVRFSVDVSTSPKKKKEESEYFF